MMYAGYQSSNAGAIEDRIPCFIIMGMPACAKRMHHVQFPQFSALGMGFRLVGPTT